MEKSPLTIWKRTLKKASYIILKGVNSAAVMTLAYLKKDKNKGAHPRGKKLVFNGGVGREGGNEGQRE